MVNQPTLIDVASPNFWTVADQVKAIVLHATAGDFQASLGWLCNPASDASANFLVDLAGDIYQLVNPLKYKRAWANGPVNKPDTSLIWLTECLRNNTNPNRVTVSIEHVASAADMVAHNPMPQAQQDASVKLVAWLCEQFNLQPSHETIVGHCQIDSVNRPNCPGVLLVSDWIERVKKTMEYDASGGFVVGEGATEILKKWGLVATTNEQYAHGDNDFIVSLTYASDGSRVLSVSSDGGKSWDCHRVVNQD